jgi:hypothetical protein
MLNINKKSSKPKYYFKDDRLRGYNLEKGKLFNSKVKGTNLQLHSRPFQLYIGDIFYAKNYQMLTKLKVNSTMTEVKLRLKDFSECKLKMLKPIAEIPLDSAIEVNGLLFELKKQFNEIILIIKNKNGEQQKDNRYIVTLRDCGINYAIYDIFSNFILSNFRSHITINFYGLYKYR